MEVGVIVMLERIVVVELIGYDYRYHPCRLQSLLFYAISK